MEICTVSFRMSELLVLEQEKAAVVVVLAAARHRAKLGPALLISHSRSQLRRPNMLSQYCASSHDHVQPGP